MSVAASLLFAPAALDSDQDEHCWEKGGKRLQSGVFMKSKSTLDLLLITY